MKELNSGAVNLLPFIDKTEKNALKILAATALRKKDITLR